jgi:hypothetical protein
VTAIKNDIINVDADGPWGGGYSSQCTIARPDPFYEEWPGSEYRFFYGAIIGQRFVILHAIQKKRQKLRARDISIAEQRYEDIKRRIHNEDS